MQAENKLVYSVAELAAVLGISRPVAYELVNREDFPSIHISPKRIVVPADALQHWLDRMAAHHE